MSYKVFGIKESIENDLENKQEWVYTGFRFLNRVKPGIINIVSRPMIGKTALLLNISRRIAHNGGKVLFITSSSKNLYIKKLAALESTFNGDEALSVTKLECLEDLELSIQEIEYYKKIKEKLSKYDISFCDTVDNNFSAADFREICRSVERNNNQIITVFLDMNFRNQTIDLEQLEKNALEDNVVVFITYSCPKIIVDRLKDKDMIRLVDFNNYYNKKFERCSNAILILERDTNEGIYNTSDSIKINILFLKNRFGPTNTYPIVLIGSTQTIFEDIPE